jgi:integrase
MAHIQDRWTSKGSAGKKVKNERWGHGKRWRVRYTGLDGKEYSESHDTEGDAKAARSRIETELSKGTWVDPALGKTTLRELAETWLGTVHGEPSTVERIISRVRTHIIPKLGHHELTVLAQRPSIVAAWLAGLGLAPNSARSVFGHLKTMLDAAVDDGMMNRNPCRVSSVKPPKGGQPRVTAWDADLVEAIRAAMDERWRVCVDAGASLGLRQGEVFGLSPGDIDWLRGVVHVKRQVRTVGSKLVFAPPKGGEERDVPLPQSVKLRFAAHLQKFPAPPVTLPWRTPHLPDSDAGRKSPDGKPRTVRLLAATPSGRAAWHCDFNRYRWWPALQAAGVERNGEHGFHTLRHTFASLLIADGVDIRKLAAYLGHGDPGFTLRIYGHFISDGGDGMRQAIDNAFSPDSTGPATAQG